MELRSSSRFPRVPPGRHGLPREFVVSHQRRRLLAATAELVAKRGYSGTALSRICGAAGVSRNTFYEHFDSKEECFLAAFDDGVAQAERKISEATPPGRPWAEQLAAGLRALLEFVSAEPAIARSCLIEVFAAGPTALERHRELIARLQPAFHRGREQASSPAPALMEQTLIHGVSFVINQRLLAGETDQLGDLLPELIEFSLAPYLGEADARRVAEGASATEPA